MSGGETLALEGSTYVSLPDRGRRSSTVISGILRYRGLPDRNVVELFRENEI